MSKEQIVVEFYYKKVVPVVPDDSNDNKPTDEPTNNPTDNKPNDNITNNPTDTSKNEDNVDKVIIADTNNKTNTTKYILWHVVMKLQNII